MPRKLLENSIGGKKTRTVEIEVKSGGYIRRIYYQQLEGENGRKKRVENNSGTSHESTRPTELICKAIPQKI